MNLSNLDPNLVAGVFSLLGTLGAWAWAKATGKKRASLTDLVQDIVLHEALDAVESGETLDRIENRLTAAAQYAAKKLGYKLKLNTTQLIVQKAIVEFRKRLRQKQTQEAAKLITAGLGELAAAAERVKRATRPKPPTSRTVPPLDLTTQAIPEK